MYWTGSYPDIVAAEAATLVYISTLPEHRNTDPVPNSTTRYDIPQETATPGVWAITAYPGLPVPPGCALVDAVDWPPEAE